MDFRFFFCHYIVLFASSGSILATLSDGFNMHARVEFLTSDSSETGTNTDNDVISITYSEETGNFSFINQDGQGYELLRVCIDLTQREKTDVLVTDLIYSKSYKLSFNLEEEAETFENALMDPIVFRVEWCQERYADSTIEFKWTASYNPKTKIFYFTPYTLGTEGEKIDVKGYDSIKILRDSIDNYIGSGTVIQLWVGQQLYTINFEQREELKKFNELLENTVCVLP